MTAKSKHTQNLFHKPIIIHIRERESLRSPSCDPIFKPYEGYTRTVNTAYSKSIGKCLQLTCICVCVHDASNDARPLLIEWGRE